MDLKFEDLPKIILLLGFIAILGAILLAINTSMQASVCTPIPTNTTDWCYPAWEHRQLYTEENIMAMDLDNYAFNAAILYDPSMNADFSDIRFALNDTNCTVLPHYLEEDGVINSVSAQAHVFVPHVPRADNVSIYMYYGNAAASSTSDGYATFAFFDDFEDGVISNSAWLVAPWSMFCNESGGSLHTDNPAPGFSPTPPWVPSPTPSPSPPF